MYMWLVEKVCQFLVHKSTLPIKALRWLASPPSVPPLLSVGSHSSPSLQSSSLLTAHPPSIMHRLPLTVFAPITEFLPLPHKLLHLSHISHTFPSLSPACFRRDALDVTQPLLDHVQKTSTVPCYVGAVDTLLFECKNQAHLDLFFRLLSAPSSTSSPPSSSPSPVSSLSHSVRCLFFIQVSPFLDDSHPKRVDLTDTLITRLSVLLPLLCSLRMSTPEQQFDVPSPARFKSLSSFAHLSSLSLINFDLSEEEFDQLSRLPLIQLNLRQSRTAVYLRQAFPPPVDPSLSGGGRRCTTLLMPILSHVYQTYHQTVNEQWMINLPTRLCAAPSSSSSSSSDDSAPSAVVERLSLSSGIGKVMGLVVQILALCPSVVVLDMGDAGYGTGQEEVESMLRAMVNEQGLPVFPHLQHCRFPSCNRREGWSPDLVVAYLRVLKAYNRQLLTIHLECGAEVEKDGDELVDAVLQCSQLTCLHLVDWRMSSSSIFLDPPRLLHLKSLTLEITSDVSNKRGAPEPLLLESKLVSILDHCPHLQSLSVKGRYLTPPDVLLWVAQRCPDLRVLHFGALNLRWAIQDSTRWDSVTAAAVGFPSLVSLTLSGLCHDKHKVPAIKLVALLRLSSHLRFLHLDTESGAALTPARAGAFAALTSLRGLHFTLVKQWELREDEKFLRCWRPQTNEVIKHYSRQLHSTTSLWCEPHLRPDWMDRVIDTRMGHDLLRCGVPSDAELEDDWPSTRRFVESVDGMTGREAFFAAIALLPAPVSNRTVPASGKQKRKEVE